jgi:hypothetical protein
MRTRDLKADRGLLTLCRFTLLQDALARAAATFEWNYTISPKTYPPNCAFIS